MEINNCPSCGGKIEFSPDDKALKCIKCEKIYAITCEKFDEKKPLNEVDDQEGFKEWENSSRNFQCTNCGAQVVLDKFEMSSKCQYCQTSSLVPMTDLPGLKPDVVLPFRLSKERARVEFKRRIKKKFFLPNAFKKQMPVAEIGATYISSFNFDCYDYATYHGIESYTTTHFDKEGHAHTKTHHRPISGKISHQFNNIVVEASDKIVQSDIEKILPFTFNEAYKFNTDFIKGYSVGYYNQTVSEAYQKAQSIAESQIEGMIKGRYESLIRLSVKHHFSDQKYNYALLPVYFINFKYKEKEYLNLMNGQNGNVGGKLPRSPIKISILVFFILLVVIGIPMLIYFLG